MCTVCHVAGHTKTTCTNEPCTNISCCKVRERHPEHRANIQELQRTINNLEIQSADEEVNIKGLRNARERAKSSFFCHNATEITSPKSHQIGKWQTSSVES